MIEDASCMYCTVNLEDIREDVQCPICLGIIRNTRAVMECMHRFCRDCIEKSFRLGRRSLREDPNFDALISLLYPNIDEYEKKSMQKAYEKTLERQSTALGKKPTSAISMKRSTVNLLRSSNRMTTRSGRIATTFVGSSSNRESALPSITKERDTKVIPNNEISESEIEVQNNEKSEGEEQIIVEGTSEDGVPQPHVVEDIISSANTLVWGRSGHRSNNRYRNNSQNIDVSRSNRLAKFMDHLHVSELKDDELDIFIKLVSFEENRVPNLPRPYLSCRPTLSIKKLHQYLALETSLQTEEIELYLVKECQPDIINGDVKLYLDNYKFEFLSREEETLAYLKTNNLSCGHMVIAYKRKMWNLNEELSFL
ncbi:hypothetical protein VNO78_16013 [Psophocarpus tetragonolobus]|uniref:RING-type domain-containing protein n=1 Tax=Psophocarpus tetragonolobus TaxID=3891 RepID=A0AAN9SF26_PSOTE